MGWNGLELKGRTELETILNFITDEETTYVTHSYNEQEGVYYFALKHKDIVTATIVSMNSFKGERENGWIYFKTIHEYAGPIYISPSVEVYDTLTPVDKDFRYEWRKLVRRRHIIKRARRRNK